MNSSMGTMCRMTPEEAEANFIENANKEPGGLTGYDCPKCLNRGSYWVMRNGEAIPITCGCMKIRESVSLITNSGIGELLDHYTFANYESKDQWQQDVKQSAMDFLENGNGDWFFIGGQVGCGKTHICTAMVKGFLDKNIPAKYMIWKDEVRELNAIVNDDVRYTEKMDKLKNIPVLYIDDFFKTETGKVPSAGDINRAFELLNYRYINKNFVTIISSEKTTAEILDIDEAVGSRIYERTKRYCWCIGRNRERNYRLRGCVNGG